VWSVPRSLTPAEIRAAAERAEAEADDVERRARLEALMLREHARALREAAAKGLTITEKSVILSHKMQAAPANRPRRKVGRPPGVKHKFRTWLEERDETIVEYAARKRLKPTTVTSYIATGSAARRVPMPFALDVQEEAGRDDRGSYRLPATLETWPNGFTAQ
jgi:hypothetical protein